MAATIRRWGLTIVLVLAVVPFVIAVFAAVHDSWRPLGDDAAIATLSHDVPTVRTPLVGMPSTIAGATTDASGAHHPGPLLFWALAVPERAAGSAPWGLLVGAAVVNAVSVLLVGWFAARTAGNAAGVAAVVLAFVTAWALGRQTIVDVWNPYIAVFPLLALLVVTWSTIAGHSRALWFVALLASFVAQAHLLYAPLGVTLGVVAIAGVVYTMVRRARAGEEWRRRATVAFGGTALVLVVVWLFPVFDFHNFRAIEESLRANQGHPVGWSYGLRVMVQAVGVLPLFARQATSYTLVGRSWAAIGFVTVVSAVVVVAALVAGTVLAWRRRDRIAFAAGAVAVLALSVSAVAMARLPAQVIDVARYRLLQVWAVGGFTWLATGVVVVRALPERVRASRALQVTGGLAAAVVMVAVIVAIPFADSDGRQDPRAADAVGVLARNELPKQGSYEIQLDTEAGLIGVDAQYGLLRELARRGYDMRVPGNDPYLGRTHAAGAATKKLLLQVGKDAVARPPVGGELLASYTAATPADVARLPAVDNAVREYLRSFPAVRAAGGDPLALPLAKMWVEGKLPHDVFVRKPYADYVRAHNTVDQLQYRLYALP